MKVVHIATNDEGGAYYAMVRIHDSMKLLGVDSKVILRNKQNNDNIGIPTEVGVKRFFSKIKNFINNCIGVASVQIDVFGSDISNIKEIKEADFLILHWTNSYISNKSFERLSRLKKKIYIVMHDMCTFTGGCHYDGYCGGYKFGCNDCPLTKSKIKKKIIKTNYSHKKDVMEKGNPILISPSTWLFEEANKSYITKALEKYVIPNPICVDQYNRIEDVRHIYDKYSLPTNKKILLFSALFATTNETKGYKYVKEALKLFQNDECILVVCGNVEGKKQEKIGNIEVYYEGIVDNKKDLIELYSVADVFISTSKQENYSNAVAEAMCCQLPVVAFDVGGMKDLITHKQNGYIARYEDIEDLYSGIVYCLSNKERLGDDAMRTRHEINELKTIGKRYCDVLEKANSL